MKHRQAQFSIHGLRFIEVFIAAAVLLVIGLIGLAIIHTVSPNDRTVRYAAFGNSLLSQKAEAPGIDNQQPPILYNLGLAELTPFNSATRMAGPMVFDQSAYQYFPTRGTKAFYEFGSRSARHSDGPQTERGLSYHNLVKGTPVIAASAGIVSDLNSRYENGTTNWQVTIREKNDSSWVVVYDYISKLKVEYGQNVQPGDIIGEAARENSLSHTFSIRVQRSDDYESYLCPATLLDTTIKNTENTKLNTLMTDWVNFSGLPLYNLDKQSTPGCLSDSLKNPDNI